VLDVFAVQGGILTIATVVLFVVKAWAFLDAISRRPDAFAAAGKMSKQGWCIILGIGLAAHMLFWHPISILNLVGTVAALVYMVDARPVMKSLTQRR
jgi:hypothetical protein